MRPVVWSEVEELFHAALERAPAERGAFLERACRGDEELRREVLSLLAEEGEARRLMEEPAAVAVTQRLAVTRGMHLGPYQVDDLVGAGGMGEVYRARDTRLDRDVAVKVLPEHVARDPEALAQFSREAHAVASLSHPHIAALFDIGESQGTHYLVMELLEGETLAARLRHGALPEREALRIGAEVAEALGAAHARGVVHRDVKPANVMLTASGTKLLDFGLARLPRKPGGDPASAGSGPSGGVVTGTVLGTVPYMAPEPLEGRPADARSDIWALGCVLFEMVTGARPFDADTPARLIAAIERDEAPSIVSRRPGTSPGLDRLVRRCLRKDPAERWTSARDVALQLREIAAEGATDEGATRRPRAVALRLVLAAAAAGLVFLLGWWMSGRPGPGASSDAVVRSVIELPAEAPLQVGWRGLPDRRELALSPDGRTLVWSGGTDDGRTPPALHLRLLGSDDSRRIAGTEEAGQPFFSPDGRWIGFFARGRLFKTTVDGRPPVELAVTGDAMGAAWSRDGRIFLGSMAGGLRSVPEEGGSPREITRVDPSREVGHRLPFLLPGGRALLFTAVPDLWGTDARVEALSLATGVRKVLVEDGADARILPTGHLVFVRRGVLMAVPFDPDRLELRAPPVAVVPGVSQALGAGVHASNSGAAQYSVADTGFLAYAAGGTFEMEPLELALVDRFGHVEPLAGFDKPLVAAGAAQLRFSPDGGYLAFVERATSGRLWLFDLRRHTHRALSRDGLAGAPAWSPDGRRLAVSWARAGSLDLWAVPVEAGAEWERLTETGAFDWGSSWSPDGRVLAFVRAGDLHLYRFAERRVVALRTTEAPEESPRFSPDGSWLAYVSYEGGQSEVHVTSFPDGTRTLVVSSQGGRAPAWSPDGRELFYRTLDGRFLMSVPVGGSGPSLALGRPDVLMPVPGEVQPFPTAFEPHPDGRRFLFARAQGKPPRPPEPILRLQLVHDWFAELERLAPTRD